MSYVDSIPPMGTSFAKRQAYADDFSGGVILGLDSFGKGADFCELENLIYDSTGGLCTRPGLCSLRSDVHISGTQHSFTKQAFFGRTIFHCGNYIYCVDVKNNAITQIYSQMPDKHSFMVPFNAKLYIYCDTRVFCVDREFNCVEEYPYAPLLYKNCKCAVATPQYEKQQSKINLIAPRIALSVEKHETPVWCSLPVKCDISRYIEVKKNGEALQPEHYEMSENGIIIKDTVTMENDGDVVVTYYTSDTDKIGFHDAFSKLKMGIAYGGNTISGTRILATGNTDEPGKFYISDLSNPLKFDVDRFDILANGTQDITGFSKQYGYLMVFTQKSVLRMSYDTLDGEPVYIVKEINCNIGCDCPNTIEVIDNKTVFANSDGNIYIIYSTESFDELNIKPISENISKGSGIGLSEIDSSALKSACSADFGRKYYICASDHIYVWDYGYGGNASKLVWYIFNGMTADYMFENGGKLCLYKDNLISFMYHGEKDFGNDINVRLKSAYMDFSEAAALKKVESICFEVRCDELPYIQLCAFADGEKYFTCRLSKVKARGDCVEMAARLPAMKLKRFAFSLESTNDICIKNALITWKSAQ